MFRRLCAIAALTLLLLACQQDAGPTPPGSAVPAAGTRPAEAVRQLVARLRANDAVGFARIAVPPDVHREVAAAWRRGDSRWPLDELPLDARLPAMLASLSAADAETRLLGVFDRQFARSERELRAAARALGLFGTEYLRQDTGYSDAEREHFGQAVAALARWGESAPLGDRIRARATVVQLASAARRTGIDDPADLARLGMEDSLRRLGPFLGAIKGAFARYGLDLDASLAGAEATLVDQTGDSARVRLRYTLGGAPVDAILPLQRVDGRWYLRDYLRHAQASLGQAGAAGAAPGAIPVAAPAQRP
jgi:hypothetical protein